MDPLIARKTWRTLEPLHGLIYFAPEAADEYAALGIEGRTGYFASRAAPMGAVPAEVVIATFFNFRPAIVRKAIPEAWAIATPDAIVAARFRGAARMLRGILGDAADGPELAEAAALARRAAVRATERPEGRPLFAGHAAIDWPDDPVLVLWHAQSLLREFRGDGHIAALLTEGITATEALVVHGATGEVPRVVLQGTRGWTDDEWDAAAESLRARGWLDDTGVLTAAGREHRQRVEDRTDALAQFAYEALTDDECARLRALACPFSKAVVQSAPFDLTSRLAESP